LPTKNTDSVINAAWLIRRYHGKAYQCKILSVVIIFVHRKKFSGLIFLFLLDMSPLTLKTYANNLKIFTQLGYPISCT